MKEQNIHATGCADYCAATGSHAASFAKEVRSKPCKSAIDSESVKLNHGNKRKLNTLLDKLQRLNDLLVLITSADKL